MVKRIRLPLFFYAILVALSAASASAQPQAPAQPKLDPALRGRVTQVTGQSRVIIRCTTGSEALCKALVQQAHGLDVRGLDIIHGLAGTVPHAALAGLEKSAAIEHMSFDQKIT